MRSRPGLHSVVRSQLLASLASLRLCRCLVAVDADAGEVCVSVIVSVTDVMDLAGHCEVADRADRISEQDARNDP